MSIDDHRYPIVKFANEMFKELEKHNDENKIKFYNKSLPKLFEMLSEQYNHRIKKIENTIFQEGTPFSTHLKIYDAIRTAKKRIHYFDRYLDADFYPLYLRDVDRSLEIRLVTTKGTQHYGATNIAAISGLAQQEFTDYKLIQCTYTDFHDRSLRIDDKIFNLGSSIKDAGKYATNFAVADNTAQAHQILDDFIKKGTVI